MKRTLMMIGAGVEQVPGIKLAREMGLRVVATDINPEAPGFEFADDRLLVSIYDVEGTVSKAGDYSKRMPLHGVITVGTDTPLTVASVAQKLDLPGISIDTAKLVSDKLLMKEKFAKDGVPIPWFRGIDSLDDLRNVEKQRGYPLVIKPVDSRGARGVLKLTKDVDLGWAYQTSRSFSPSGRVMVEEYLSGPQVSTESIILDSRTFTPGLSDRNYEFIDLFAPYMIENGGELPSYLDKGCQNDICLLVEKATRSMEIYSGTAKGDIVLTESGPKIIEMAARLSGGYFCTHEIPLSTGVNFVGAAIRIALGETPDELEVMPKYHRYIAQRYIFPPGGRIKNIRGADEVNSLDWIKLFKLYVKPGDVTEPVTSHTKRGGVVIAIGETRKEAVERAKRAIDMIIIETGDN